MNLVLVDTFCAYSKKVSYWDFFASEMKVEIQQVIGRLNKV